jgi:hypothetical protein
MQNTPLHPELLSRRPRAADEPSHQRCRKGGAPPLPAASISSRYGRNRAHGHEELSIIGVLTSARRNSRRLHVVAAGGDGDRYLKSASVIYGKARHLLEARNRGRSTPLHRAARAGNVEMLSLLIRLAGEEEDRVATRSWACKTGSARRHCTRVSAPRTCVRWRRS